MSRCALTVGLKLTRCGGRIPVPEVWRDLLEKIKAAGFNGISVYAYVGRGCTVYCNQLNLHRHWAFHAPNNKTLDFTSGARNFEPILDIAKEVGLFVTMRGGPYVKYGDPHSFCPPLHVAFSVPKRQRGALRCGRLLVLMARCGTTILDILQLGLLSWTK